MQHLEAQPAIQWTRDLAEARPANVVMIQCHSCKHEVKFGSEEELIRFCAPSQYPGVAFANPGWRIVDTLAKCPLLNCKPGDVNANTTL